MWMKEKPTITKHAILSFIYLTSKLFDYFRTVDLNCFSLTLQHKTWKMRVRKLTVAFSPSNIVTIPKS